MPIPRFLVDELAVHVRVGLPTALVFPGVRGGGALRVRVFRRAAFDEAAVAIGLTGLHPHELRHTAASPAIDLYGHLFADQLDDVAERLEAAARTARGPAADFLRTSGRLLKLPATVTVAKAQ